MEMKKELNRKFLHSDAVDSPSRDSIADIGSPFPAAIIRVHAAAATVVIATGMLVLVGGWSLGIEPLKGIFPGFPSMKVNTAIGFILCGLSLWLRNRPSPKAHRAAGILGGLVALLGAASLAQYLSGMNFGIDELFFRDAPSAFTSHPGRMSSNTALSFILIGCSLVALPSAAAVWLAIASLLPVLLSVAGYIYGATAFVGLLSLTGMAFHTIASFLLLVVGVLTTPPMRGLAVWLLSAGPEGTLLRCMMPAAIFIVVGTAIITQRGFSAGIYTEQSRDALNLFASLVALCGLTLVIARIVARVGFERKQAAQAVSESEQRYRSLYDNNLDPIFSLGNDGRFVSANAAAQHVSGYTLEELESLHFLDLCAPEQRDAAKDAFRDAICRRCRDLETAIINKSGDRRDLFITGAPVIVDGEIVGVSCIARDITESKRAGAMMRSRLRLSELARNATVEELIQCGLDEAESFTGSTIGFFHFVNKDQETLSLQTWSSNTLKTMCSAEGKGLHYPIDQAGVWADCFHAEAPVIHNDYQSVPHRKGMPERHPPVVRDLALPVVRQGRVAAIIGVGNKAGDYTDADVGVMQDFASLIIDLVESKQAEDTLRENELFYRQTLDSIPGMVFTTRPDGYCDYQSQRWVDFTGVPMSEHLGNGWNMLLHPDDRPRAFAAWRAAVEERAPYDLQYRVRRHDGAYKWFKVLGRPIRNESGEIVRWFGAALDIDDLVEAQEALQASEEELRRINEELEQRVAVRTKELAKTIETLREEMEERRRAQDQLLQSQKMETVGRLAGGIAHDFNNLLMVMSGFAEQAQEVSEDPTAKEALQHVITAGSKAKELTHKLLTFSRQHIMQKRRINLGGVVDEMLRLLKRLIGENIEVRLSVASVTITVDADPGQIEQVLTNIVLNARDSMPAGGTLSLSVRRERVEEAAATGLEVGEYAVIEIRDTGVGIPPGDIDRIFDPFFSTKETGKGTGLGLSIAYGIVKQHAGAITVQSSPGSGSTFRVFLPLVEEEPERMPVSVAAAVQGGGETLLLVEDDPTVRLFLRKIMEKAGYAVLEAGNGEEALRLAEENAFSLLVSDMLMPKMNGMELYAALKEKKPDMHCVLISGYSSDILQETLPPDMVFVQKPVTKEDLLLTVATALSRRDPASCP